MGECRRMVEVEEVELERLRGIETQHTTLLEEHEKLKGEHSTLKDDYIALAKGQQAKTNNTVDEFDEYCKQRYGK